MDESLLREGVYVIHELHITTGMQEDFIHGHRMEIIHVLVDEIHNSFCIQPRLDRNKDY